MAYAFESEKNLKNRSGVGVPGGSGTSGFHTADATGVPAPSAPSASPANAAPSTTASPANAAPSTTAELRQAANASAATAQVPRADTAAMRSYLDQWRQSAEAQSASRIDRATDQSVTELERVREQTLPQFQTQRNQIDADERRSADNLALYDAARGGGGGIGREQYGSVMNVAAQNRMAVNAAERDFKTDLARQIQQIRSQGDYQKEQELFQISQNYLSQILEIDKRAQVYDLSAAQVNAQLEQWRLGYLLQLKQLDLSTEQWERTFAADRDDEGYRRKHEQERDAVADNQWELLYKADRDDEGYRRKHEQERDAVADNQWELVYKADRDDEGYRQKHERERDAVADSQWKQSLEVQQQQHADSLALQQQQHADNVAIQQQELGIKKQQYEESQADAKRQRAQSYAMDMMNLGMRPDPDTLKDAGYSDAFADLYLSTVGAAKQAAASGGDLTAMARAYVASGSDAPKTWIAAHYKEYGFSSKPDADEFEDAADAVREIGDLTLDFSPDEGIITFNGKKFSRLDDFLNYINALPLNQSEWERVMKQIERWPELSVALRLEA